jgi:hypothetical protein
MADGDVDVAEVDGSGTDDYADQPQPSLWLVAAPTVGAAPYNLQSVVQALQISLDEVVKAATAEPLGDDNVVDVTIPLFGTGGTGGWAIPAAAPSAAASATEPRLSGQRSCGAESVSEDAVLRATLSQIAQRVDLLEELCSHSHRLRITVEVPPHICTKIAFGAINPAVALTAGWSALTTFRVKLIQSSAPLIPPSDPAKREGSPRRTGNAGTVVTIAPVIIPPAGGGAGGKVPTPLGDGGGDVSSRLPQRSESLARKVFAATGAWSFKKFLGEILSVPERKMQGKIVRVSGPQRQRGEAPRLHGLHDMLDAAAIQEGETVEMELVDDTVPVPPRNQEGDGREGVMLSSPGDGDVACGGLDHMRRTIAEQRAELIAMRAELDAYRTQLQP